MQAKTNVHALPRSVEERIYLLSRSAREARQSQSLSTAPATFGVYLGALSLPITDSEIEKLTQWEAIVLDYSQPGILDTVSSDNVSLGPHIIARLDFIQILKSKTADTEIDLSRVVYMVSKVVQQELRRPDQKRYFTGVVIAGWRERIPVPLLHGLTKLLSAYGLDVYLEVGPPNFLEDVERLEVGLFSGLIVRNGTILPNGERRDFFDMDKMKTTTKAFVSQACQRPFITMMWDTIDNDVPLSHAVVRRAHMWCNYHGAVPYLCRKAALENIADIQNCEEPLAAFQWLKSRRVMIVHEKYRTARAVSCSLTCNVLVADDSTVVARIYKQH